VFAVVALLLKTLGATLSLKAIDPLTYLFLLQIFTVGLGAALISSGFVSSPWLVGIYGIEKTYLRAWMTVCWGISAPVVIMATVKYFHIGPNVSIWAVLRRRLTNISEGPQIVTWFVMMFVVTLSACYTILTIGKLPLLELFSGSNYAAKAIRASSKLDFSGISAIKNYLFIALAQILAYFSYSQALRFSESKAAKLRFYISLFLAFLATTISLEKAPFVIFLLGFLIVRGLHSREVSSFLIIVFGLSASLLLLGAYIITGGSGRLLTLIIEELIGRLFLSQVVGVYLSYYVFPDIHPFIGLDGIGVIADAIGFSQSPGSGRLLMEYVRPADVHAGIMGYMSSHYIAEAYANFSYYGVFFAPIWLGLILYCGFHLISRVGDASIAVALVVYMTTSAPITSSFVSFYYNPGLIILITLLAAMRVLVRQAPARSF
jgi:hypothetical protein